MKVVHIAQTHGRQQKGYMPSKEEFDIVVKSQFEIAKFILANSNLPVISESNSKNCTFTDFYNGNDLIIGPYKTNHKDINKIFNKGFPDSYDILNEIQKEALYCFGADNILLLLNKIPIIYKSYNKSLAVRTNNFFENDLKNASQLNSDERRNEFIKNAANLHTDREQSALMCAKEAVSIHYKEDLDNPVVILVYGASHNFKALCDQNNIAYEKIYTHESHKKYYNNFQPENYEKFYNDQIKNYKYDQLELNFDNINTQTSLTFSLQKIKILTSIILIASGSVFLAMFSLMSLANPTMAIVAGIIFMSAGLAISMYLLAEHCKPPPLTFGLKVATGV